MFGPRVPYEYIPLAGIGQSSVQTPSGDAFETAAYDAALLNVDQVQVEHGSTFNGTITRALNLDEQHTEATSLASMGVANCNMLLYSSLVPRDAREIPFLDGIKRMPWGAVMESIYAESKGKQGDVITAGLILTRVISPDGQLVGIYADEYTGNKDEHEALQLMMGIVVGMARRRGFGHIDKPIAFGKTFRTDRGFHIHPFRWIVSSTKVTEKFGVALAGIGFVSFQHAPVKPQPDVADGHTRKVHPMEITGKLPVDQQVAHSSGKHHRRRRAKH